MNKRILLYILPAFLSAVIVSGWFFVVKKPAMEKEQAYGRHVDRAETLVASRDYSEARAELRKAIKILPDWPQARILLAVCRIKDGVFQEAIDDLNDVAADPALDAEIRDQIEVLLGESYLGRYQDTKRNRDFQLSRASLERVQNTKFRNRALASLGILHFAHGSNDNQAKAIEFWDALAEEAPESDEYAMVKELREQFVIRNDADSDQ